MTARAALGRARMRRFCLQEFILIVKIYVIDICLAATFITFVVVETVHIVRFLLKTL
jgi:hypothetical protein